MSNTTLTSRVGERIRYHRNKHGWSQTTLAEKAGMSTNHIGQIERGEKNPTLTTLEKITSAFDISLSQFLENISPVDNPHENKELNEAYQLLLSLSKDEQKLVCEIINTVVKITRL